jgi:hypothetical protein
VKSREKFYHEPKPTLMAITFKNNLMHDFDYLRGNWRKTTYIVYAPESNGNKPHESSPCTKVIEYKSKLEKDLPPVKHDPALNVEGYDLFIKDYFFRLRNDIEQPINITEAEPLAFERRFIFACAFRAFIITEKGRLGIALRNTKPGDKIAVLSGQRIWKLMELV